MGSLEFWSNHQPLSMQKGGAYLVYKKDFKREHVDLDLDVFFSETNGWFIPKLVTSQVCFNSMMPTPKVPALSWIS